MTEENSGPAGDDAAAIPDAGAAAAHTFPVLVSDHGSKKGHDTYAPILFPDGWFEHGHDIQTGPADDDAAASADAGAAAVHTLPAPPDGVSKQGHDIQTGPADDDAAPAL
jgi:hypothetical protein